MCEVKFDSDMADGGGSWGEESLVGSKVLMHGVGSPECELRYFRPAPRGEDHTRVFVL